MSGSFALDWASMAVSLANVILLIWLGLTVLLNAERRTWAVWLAGGGMLLGGVFFVSHSALLGHGPFLASGGMNVWWHVGWVPVLALPFVWYVVMLWYTGFWRDGGSRLRRRHRPWLIVITFLAGALVSMVAFANPLPSFWQVAQLELSATLSVGGIPILILAYPGYTVLCIALSLDALRRPGPLTWVMGDLARRRARPWLVAASVTLLAVSLLVAIAMGWLVVNARGEARGGITPGMLLTVAWLDLTISSLIGASVVLVGRAVTSYEVFTGKALPRRGFFRHWRSTVILAAGYGAVVGWGLTRQLRPVYSLLLTTVLMVTFYALFSWRSYAEQDRYIEQLRPFVASQGLYERLLTPAAESDSARTDAVEPFRALCEDVLGARTAYLVAVGPLAPLVGPPLVYPDEGGSRKRLSPSLARAAAEVGAPHVACTPLDPAQHGGARWAVPLWGERGLVGTLFLGEKRDGGLYTQEEMEIARTTGERLIDGRASAEMARRLMALQRQRLAQSQVLDRRARRVLHDEILPDLHAAMLTLDDGAGSSEAVDLLADVHRRISNLLHEMPATTARAVKRLGLLAALRRTVDDEFGGAFDNVTWRVEAASERRIEAVPPMVAEVLFCAAREAVRNAARHGRGAVADRSLHLAVEVSLEDGLTIAVEDDGVGPQPREVLEGEGGRGLTLHSTMMAVIGGTLTVEGAPGAGTRVSVTVPARALDLYGAAQVAIARPAPGISRTR
jgi:signal transduction histidine kinase